MPWRKRNVVRAAAESEATNAGENERQSVDDDAHDLSDWEVTGTLPPPPPDVAPLRLLVSAPDAGQSASSDDPPPNLNQAIHELISATNTEPEAAVGAFETAK